MTRRRRRALFAIGLCGAAIIAIVVLAVVLSENVVYFRTVSEAVAQHTIVETRDGVKFEISDGKATAEVIHQGDPPELFKPGAPVVCEGHWGRGSAFDSDRILIKHGNDYQPPKVDTKGGTA